MYLGGKWVTEITTTFFIGSNREYKGIGQTNLVVDGSMEDRGIAAWPGASSAIVTKDTTDPRVGLRNLRVARNGVTNPSARQDYVMIAGQKYFIDGFVRSGGGSALPRVSVGPTTAWSGSTSTIWTYFSVDDVIAGADDLRLYAITAIDGEYAEFDNISVLLRPTMHTGIYTATLLPDTGDTLEFAIVINEDTGFQQECIDSLARAFAALYVTGLYNVQEGTNFDGLQWPLNERVVQNLTTVLNTFRPRGAGGAYRLYDPALYETIDTALEAFWYLYIS
jgi:hypothetical protein